MFLSSKHVTFQSRLPSHDRASIYPITRTRQFETSKHLHLSAVILLKISSSKTSFAEEERPQLYTHHNNRQHFFEKRLK